MRLDVLALGEVMLRLDPGEGRISTARSFTVWEGGGEYNVARALATSFDRPAGVVTALVDDPLGHHLEGLVRAGRVDVGRVLWVAAGQGGDGPSGPVRTGLNFVERGYGVRGALGVSDRSSSAASRLAVGDVDWDAVLDGVTWLHTGGVFAGLSPTTTELAEQALGEARRRGVGTSYDVNHRPSLWRARGGASAALAADRRLAALADVVFGALQLGEPGGGELADVHDAARGLERVSAGLGGADRRRDRPADRSPVLVSSWRRVVSAGVNDWGAAAWSASSGPVAGPVLREVAVLDRIGSGDALAAGVLHGLLGSSPVESGHTGAGPTGGALQHALALGVAAGALTMTTPGDTCAATREEIEALAAGGSAHVRR